MGLESISNIYWLRRLLGFHSVSVHQRLISSEVLPTKQWRARQPVVQFHCSRMPGIVQSWQCDDPFATRCSKCTNRHSNSLFWWKCPHNINCHEWSWSNCKCQAKDLKLTFTLSATASGDVVLAAQVPSCVDGNDEQVHEQGETSKSERNVVNNHGPYGHEKDKPVRCHAALVSRNNRLSTVVQTQPLHDLTHGTRVTPTSTA